jgi:hypothetical protein
LSLLGTASPVILFGTPVPTLVRLRLGAGRTPALVMLAK